MILGVAEDSNPEFSFRHVYQTLNNHEELNLQFKEEPPYRNESHFLVQI